MKKPERIRQRNKNQTLKLPSFIRNSSSTGGVFGAKERKEILNELKTTTVTSSKAKAGK